MSQDQELDLAPNVEPIILDIPALTEEQVGESGVYVGVANTDPAEEFIGASVLLSEDDGVTFEEIQSFRGETVTAHVVGSCGGGVSGRFWDTLTTLRVQLTSATAELLTETEEAVWSGRKNILLVGQEIIGFCVATPTGTPREYDLTKLARGRRNTEEWIEKHADNEEVVLLSSPSALQFVTLSPSKVSPLEGRVDNPTWRATSGGLPATDSVREKVLPFEAKTMQPFVPTVKPAERDSVGNITIRISPRSNRIFRLLSCVKDDRLECCGCAQLEIDILTDDRATVLRRFILIGRTDFVYTLAKQTVDFGSAKNPVQVAIYASAEMVGRGRSLGGTV